MKKKIFTIPLLIAGSLSILYAQTCEQLLQQTKVAFYQGDYQTVKHQGALALQCLEMRLGIEKKTVLGLLHQLGWAELELQDYPNAQAYFLKAYTQAQALYPEEAPKTWEAQLDLGECYYKSGQYKEALAILQDLYASVFAHNPKQRGYYEAEVQRQLAEVTTALGYFEEARGYYYALLKSTISNSETVYWQRKLTRLSMLESNYTQADSLFESIKINLEADKTTPTKDWLELWLERAGFWQELGEYTKADSLYLLTWQQLRNSTEDLAVYRAFLFNNWANLHQKKANFTLADSLLEVSSVLTERLYGNDSPTQAVALFNQGKSKQLQGKYNEALGFYQQAIRIDTSYYGSGSLVYATDLTNLSLLYQSLGDFQKADNLMQQVMGVERVVLGQKHPRFAKSLSNYANIQVSVGAYTLADSLQREALKILKYSLGVHHPDYQIVNSNYASLKIALGEYAEAETMYLQLQNQQAIQIGTQHPDYANTLQNMASLLTLLGQYERAERLYIQSGEVYLKTLGKQHPLYLSLQHNLAFLYQKNQQLSEAQNIYKQILPIEEQVYGETHPNYANALNDYAWLCVQLKDFTLADSLYRVALEIRAAHFGTSHLLYAKTLRNLGNLAEIQNQYTIALEYYTQSLEVFKNELSEQHTQYAETLNDLARIHFKITDLAEANRLYQNLYAITQDLIRDYLPYLNEAEKESFYLNTLRSFLSSYQQFALLVQEENPLFVGQLLNLVLNTKGVLLEGQKELRAQLNTNAPPLLKEQLDAWYYLKNQLANLYRSYDADYKKIDSLETNASLLEKQLTASSPNFIKKNQQKFYTWQQISEVLTKDEVAIEILRVEMKELTQKEEVWYAFLLISNDKNPQLVLMKNGIALDKDAYQDYTYKTVEKIYDDTSYIAFWKILEPHIKKYKKVYLSADGVYHLINPNGMYNSDKQSYLIDYLNIQVLNSTRDLLADIQPTSPKTVAHLFGYPIYARLSTKPLPNTAVEINKIAQLLEEKSIAAQTYLQQDASESKLKKVKKPYLLHIATHGYFSQKDKYSYAPSNPLHRAGLLLTSSHKAGEATSDSIIANDGYLTAYEAMNLDLQGTEMVVLSACETGLGEVQPFEGVYGLQRAFQIAGASTILMSLWKVSDEATLFLMTEFYALWQGGLERQVAFRIAQQKLKEEYKYPYYWSAFVMVGN